MADRKISDLTALTTPASGDFLPIVDISEAAAASKNKRITIEELMRGVPNGTAAAPGIAFETDPNTGIYRPGADQLAVATNGTGRLFVDATGRVGIGATPTARLHLQTTSENAVLQMLENNGSTVYGASIDAFNSSGGNIRFRLHDSGGTFQERLRITSAGLVGIGVSAPQAKLHISDPTASAVELMRLQANLNSPSGNKSITWADATDVVGRISVDYTTPTAKMRFGSLYNSGYQTSDLMTLTPTGLGIGSTTVDEHLHVEGIGTQRVKIEATDTSVAGLVMLNTNRRYDVQVNGSDLQIYDNTASAERVRLDASGRLLIGTSSVLSASSGHIIQAADSTGVKLSLGRSATSVASDVVLASLNGYSNGGSVYQESGNIQIVSDGVHASGDKPGRLVFSTTEVGAASPTERMRIKSNGDLWLGAPSANPGYGTSTTGFGWRNDTDTLYVSAASDPALRLNRNGDGAVVEFRHTGNAVAVGSITVTVAATAYNTSSDYRLKENVTAVSDGITRLQQLKPSRFNFIADPAKTVDGFIAHEVQAVVPEAITGEKDAVDDDGNPEYQGIDQSKLVPLLTAALQEAIGEIESLKARVAALEAN
jgi:hypothetical protein